MSLNPSGIATSAIQAALWLLRRYDYYVTGSLVTLNNLDHYKHPWVTFNKLRERGPIMRSVANRGWIVTGHKEVTELLRDRRIGSDVRQNQFYVTVLKLIASGLEVPMVDNPTMLTQDPPDHTRLRKLVAQGFTNKYIQSLAPDIEKLGNELLDELSPDVEVFDVIHQLAQPLPAIVIAEMMGVPKSDREKFIGWSNRLINLTEIRQPKLMRDAAQAISEMREYMAYLVSLKKRHPGDDLLSKLIAAEEDGDSLTLDELYSTAVMLLTAGHETTTRLIGNCLYLLLSHPEQMAALQKNPGLLDAAIEETLRFESPVSNTVRFVRETFRYEGKKLKKGQLLLVSFSAANHDPALNENPDIFDIGRDDIRHIGFGHGIHLCIGASLARLEARIALQCLLQRYPEMKLYSEVPDWGTNDFFRGLETLNLSV